MDGAIPTRSRFFKPRTPEDVERFRLIREKVLASVHEGPVEDHRPEDHDPVVAEEDWEKEKE